jgi:prepilin-type N-terminal cleavage/methylation domain-containing protein
VSARVRPRDQAGYTLVELLTTMFVGGIVLSALFGLLDVSLVAGNRVTNRVDAVQRGRVAVEQLTQVLRSQTCLGPGVPPVVQGDDNSLTFYADIGDDKFNPDKRKLVYTPPSGSTLGYVTESVYPATGGSLPALTFAATPSRVRRVVGGITSSGLPLLRYYAYTTTDPPTATVQLPTPLSTADLARVVKIDVSFTVRPTQAPAETRADARFDNSVYVRTADPTNPTKGPVCLV